MNYSFKLSFITLLLSATLVAMQPQNPNQNRHEPIATTGNIEIYLKIFNNNPQNRLEIDTLSPFDISPTSFTRKQWGQIAKNNELQVTGEKVSFDKLDGKSVAAIHIHSENNKNDGIVAKIFLDSEKKNIETHLYAINGISQSLIKKENFPLKSNGHKTAMITFNFTIDSNNWKNVILSFDSQDREIPLPQVPQLKSNTGNKWKFWKK
jgi:hypothetical protein